MGLVDPEERVVETMQSLAHVTTDNTIADEQEKQLVCLPSQLPVAGVVNLVGHHVANSFLLSTSHPSEHRVLSLPMVNLIWWSWVSWSHVLIPPQQF